MSYITQVSIENPAWAHFLKYHDPEYEYEDLDDIEFSIWLDTILAPWNCKDILGSEFDIEFKSEKDYIVFLLRWL